MYWYPSSVVILNARSLISALAILAVALGNWYIDRREEETVAADLPHRHPLSNNEDEQYHAMSSDSAIQNNETSTDNAPQHTGLDRGHSLISLQHDRGTCGAMLVTSAGFLLLAFSLLLDRRSPFIDWPSYDNSQSPYHVILVSAIVMLLVFVAFGHGVLFRYTVWLQRPDHFHDRKAFFVVSCGGGLLTFTALSAFLLDSKVSSRSLSMIGATLVSVGPAILWKSRKVGVWHSSHEDGATGRTGTSDYVSLFNVGGVMYWVGWFLFWIGHNDCRSCYGSLLSSGMVYLPLYFVKSADGFQDKNNRTIIVIVGTILVFGALWSVNYAHDESNFVAQNPNCVLDEGMVVVVNKHGEQAVVMNSQYAGSGDIDPNESSNSQKRKQRRLGLFTKAPRDRCLSDHQVGFGCGKFFCGHVWEIPILMVIVYAVWGSHVFAPNDDFGGGVHGGGFWQSYIQLLAFVVWGASTGNAHKALRRQDSISYSKWNQVTNWTMLVLIVLVTALDDEYTWITCARFLLLSLGGILYKFFGYDLLHRDRKRGATWLHANGSDDNPGAASNCTVFSYGIPGFTIGLCLLAWGFTIP
jgi:hypothetical protein